MRGVIRVTFIRPNLSGHKNGTINDTEKLIYNCIVSSPGISAVALANEFDKSVRTIMRALKHFVNLNIVAYRGSKKTGGYYIL
ncbi:MAG: winged helix-turn-helix transcriptional regulator [Bacteroides sp.]|nr:winged helix-turn-helix transcriptional regulator [Bacteroides sp.]